MKLIIIGPSGPRENQNTIEKNEFYEWGIWRTIMGTMGGNSSICIKINSWPQYYRAPPALLLITGPVPANLFNSWPPPDQIRSDQTGAPPAPLPTTGPIQTNISIAGPPRSTGTSPAPRPTIGPYRPTSDLFSAGITPRRQHHMEVFDDFHIEEYFHRFFSSWGWILNLFHFILFYIQWLVISFWSFSLMKQSYWEKWLLMTELFEKFWKVVVFRRQVCHNQYWLHTDYKPESIKIKKTIQSIDLQIDSIEKNIIRKNYFQLTKQILNQKDTAVFYTDKTYDEKSKISTASVVLYQNFKILSKSWNLKIEMNITDAEIYIIEKTIEWINNLMNFHQIYNFSLTVKNQSNWLKIRNIC